MQATEIQIVTGQAALLSSYETSIRHQMSMLMNELAPKQLIDATLDLVKSDSKVQAVLVIKDVAVPISNAQLQQLQNTGRRQFQFKVTAVDQQQLQLKLQPATSTTVRTEQLPPADPTDPEVVRTVDQASLLQLLKDIHQGTESVPATDKSSEPTSVASPAQPTSPAGQMPPDTVIQQAGATDSSRANELPVRPEFVAPKANAPTTESRTMDTHQVRPASGGGTRINSTQVFNSPVQIDNSELKPTPGNSVESDKKPPQSDSRFDRSAVFFNENASSVSDNKTSQPVTEFNNPIETKHYLPGLSANTASTGNRGDTVPIAAQKEHKQSLEGQIGNKTPNISSGESTSTQTQAPTINRDAQLQIDKTSAYSTETQTPAESNVRLVSLVPEAYSKPSIRLDIQIPSETHYPILAQSVVQASQRLAQNRAPITDHLNRLFAQLDRLNQWQSDNKRHLRTDQGQLLNKAATDIQQALKETRSYLNQPGTLKDGQSIRKALRQSGVFLEQKYQPGEQRNSERLQPSLHTDTKANLQRLVSAGLYHLAKLASLYQASGAATQGTTAPHSKHTTNPTLATDVLLNKPDLIGQIKQRLHAFGDKSLPADLPSQLIRLLRQILDQSNQSLNRSQLTQLGNLRPDSMSPQWFFELPLWTGERLEPLQLLIKQESKTSKSDKSPVWSLVMQFDIQQLGKIRAILQWQAERVSIQFLAEHRPTSQLIESELDYVREILKAHQLQLDSLEVTQAELKDISVSYPEKQGHD